MGRWLTRSGLRHGLRSWPALHDIFSKTNKLLLLADFDGTLSPIAPTPEQARIVKGIPGLLLRLSKIRGLKVGIVSGRSIRVARKLVGVRNLIYVGNHGFEIQGPKFRYVHPKAVRSRPALREISVQLRRLLKDVSGSRIEHKELSLSVHWRKVSPRDVNRLQRIVKEALRPWVKRKCVRVTHGKCVIEVRPPIIWDKGRSIEWIIRRTYRTGKFTVCYLGDDRTDEDGFRSVNRLKGISIFVGHRRTHTKAYWHLADPYEVLELFKRILDARRCT